MPFTPQIPFPKSRGDALRSTDWNDLIAEVQRLDSDKVNRSGDKIGSLSVTGALGVGAAANDDIPLQVQSSGANRSPLSVLSTPNNEDFLSLFGGRRNSQLPFLAWKRGDLRVGTATAPDGSGMRELLRVNSSDTAAARLEVDGRVRAGQALVGPWPANPAQYAFFGSTSLDQTQSGNYALLQGTTGSDNGVTYVNSSASLRLRINNGDRLVIQNNGNIDVVAPSNLSFGSLTRQMINLWSTEYGIGVQASTVYFRTGNHFAWYRGSGHNDAAFHPGFGGRTLMRLDLNGNLFIRGQIFPGVNFNDPNIIIGPIIDPVLNPPIITPSDERLKCNIAPLQGALERLLQLRGVTFDWNTEIALASAQHTGAGEPQIGLIAQEVEQVFPQWVSSNGDGYKHLAIRGFEALAIEALRDLRAEIHQLRARVRVLEAAAAA